MQEIHFQPLHHNFSLVKNFVFRDYSTSPNVQCLDFKNVMSFLEISCPSSVLLKSWNCCIATSSKMPMVPPGLLLTALPGYPGSQRHRDASAPATKHRLYPHCNHWMHWCCCGELLGGLWLFMFQTGL